ncbi:MAG: hypothetical protein HY877_00275 [Deltaproteobacteria bacterium]|nr:hypothetical protein [Deltaproteobacteria bacterium]
MKKLTWLLPALIPLCLLQMGGRSSGKHHRLTPHSSASGSLGKTCRPDHSCDKGLVCKGEICIQQVTGGDTSGEPAPQGGGGGKKDTPSGGSSSGGDSPSGGNSPSGTAPLSGDPNHIEGYYRSVWTCTCNPDIGGPPIENDDERIVFKPFPNDNGMWVMYYDISNGGFTYHGGNCSIDRSGGIMVLCDKCTVSGKKITFKPCRTEGCICDSVWTKTREFEKD